MTASHAVMRWTLIRVCPRANAAMTAVPQGAITIIGTAMQSGVRPATASCCPATAWMSM